jgi:Zn-finger nucleic acid-binding protein
VTETVICPNCDATMKRSGINEWDTLYICPRCGDELDTNYWGEYPEWVDIIEGEEGGRFIGKGSEYAPDDEVQL